MGKEFNIKVFNYYLFSLYSNNGFKWFRLFGKGLVFKDINKHNLLFSERYGYKKYFKINKWLIKTI